MKLSDLGILATQPAIAFVGKPEPTGKTTSEGDEYFAWKLKTPIIVRCSVDPAIEAVEVEELYIRQSDLEKDIWTEIVAGKPKEGLTVPGWRADFSKSHEVAIYQETTIAQWARENRGAKRQQLRSGINERIKARQAKKS